MSIPALYQFNVVIDIIKAATERSTQDTVKMVITEEHGNLREWKTKLQEWLQQPKYAYYYDRVFLLTNTDISAYAGIVLDPGNPNDRCHGFGKHHNISTSRESSMSCIT